MRGRKFGAEFRNVCRIMRFYKKWFRKKCVEVVQSFVDTPVGDTYLFRPAVPVEARVSADSKAIAARYILKVQAFHVPLIEVAVDDAVRLELEKIPDYLRKNQRSSSQELSSETLSPH